MGSKRAKRFRAAAARLATARPRASSAAATAAFDELLSTPLNTIPRLDMALCNLICAEDLPGAEDMDIAECMRRLQALTDYVREKTAQQLLTFRSSPGKFRFPRPVTENFFRVIALVHAIKTDAGLRYNPQRTDEKSTELPFSSKDMLINGLLSDERIGTCNTIPVLIAAVGRRLGYPLHLCCTHTHVWTRWEGDGERFNIEASGPNDFSDFDDDHFRAKLESLRKAGIDTSYYLKNLTPADELALFLFSRAWVLEDHQRFDEALPAWAKACFLAPLERMYALRGYEAAYEVLHIRKFGKPAVRGPDRRPLTTVPVGENLAKLLPPKELGMFLSINAHYHEVKGEVEPALDTYKQALVVQPENADYLADLERYVKRLAHEGPPSFAAHDVARGLGFADEVVAAYEQRGLRAEKAKNWTESQCAFVQGSSFREGNTSCAEHLKRAIRKEIDAGFEPKSGQGGADPRLALPHELQGTIWMFRDLALRSLGRKDEALAACQEACRLHPTQPRWAEELQRFTQEHARLKWQPGPWPQGSPNQAVQGQFIASDIKGIVVADAPIHTSVTLCGSQLPPMRNIKTKEYDYVYPEVRRLDAT